MRVFSEKRTSGEFVAYACNFKIGHAMFTENDEDRDGFFETLEIVDDSDGRMFVERFKRERDSSVHPVTAEELKKTQDSLDRITAFWDKFWQEAPGRTKLPSEDRKALEDSSRFHKVHSTGDLPAAILELCSGDNGRLAEPGQKWNATDVITDPNLPGKRLIWATIGGDYYVVHYERGGIAHTYHVLVANLTKTEAKPKVAWRAVGGPFKDYAAFLDALRSGKLDDRLDYTH